MSKSWIWIATVLLGAGLWTVLAPEPAANLPTDGGRAATTSSVHHAGEALVAPPAGESTRARAGGLDVPFPTPDEGDDMPEEREHALVRVAGFVRHGAVPVDGCDLLFLRRGTDDPVVEDWVVEDWDVTNEDGRFEVELPPGDYAVLEDEEGGRLLDLTVPRNLTELRLDIPLPAGDER